MITREGKKKAKIDNHLLRKKVLVLCLVITSICEPVLYEYKAYEYKFFLIKQHEKCEKFFCCFRTTLEVFLFLFEWVRYDHAYTSHTMNNFFLISIFLARICVYSHFVDVSLDVGLSLYKAQQCKECHCLPSQ